MEKYRIKEVNGKFTIEKYVKNDILEFIITLKMGVWITLSNITTKEKVYNIKNLQNTEYETLESALKSLELIKKRDKKNKSVSEGKNNPKYHYEPTSDDVVNALTSQLNEKGFHVVKIETEEERKERIKNNN